MTNSKRLERRIERMVKTVDRLQENVNKAVRWVIRMKGTDQEAQARKDMAYRDKLYLAAYRRLQKAMDSLIWEVV